MFFEKLSCTEFKIFCPVLWRYLLREFKKMKSQPFSHAIRNIVLTTFLLVSATVAHGGELDIDGDGKSDALTDGLLVIRHLFGFSGNT